MALRPVALLLQPVAPGPVAEAAATTAGGSDSCSGMAPNNVTAGMEGALERPCAAWWEMAL